MQEIQYEKKIKYEAPNKNLVEAIKENPELVMTSLSSLTDLEQKVIAVLYQLNQAVPTETIKKRLVENSREFYKTPSKNSFENYILFGFPFESFFRISVDKVIKTVGNKTSGTLKAEEVLDNLPSFRRIRNTLLDLISLNIVATREIKGLKNKKIKGLFYLNPMIRFALDNIKNTKIEEYKKEHKEHKEHIDKINAELIKKGSGIIMNY